MRRADGEDRPVEIGHGIRSVELIESEYPSARQETNARRFIAFTAIAGVIEGGIVAYLPVMLARMGANAATVSMLNSGLAVAVMVMALPSGAIVARQPDLVRFLFNWVMVTRLIFLTIALVPFLEGWWVPFAVAALWALHGLPAALVNNAFFGVLAEAVPARMRPRVNGVRWGLFGVVAAVASGAFGYALDQMPFPLGYQAIFALSAILGGIGAFWLRGIAIDRIAESAATGARGALSWRAIWPRDVGREFVEFQVLTAVLRLGIHIPIGLFSIIWVNELQATDTWIGVRSTIANGGLVVGYFGWGWLSARIGPRWTLAVSSAGMGLYPGLTAIGPTVEWMLPAALAWGIFVAGVDFALVEGLLRACPRERRAELVAVHQFQANVVLFVAPLLGAWLASLTSNRVAMLVAVGFHVAVLVVVAVTRQRDPSAEETTRS